MTDISAVLERLKKNKLLLPAIAVGVVGGGYLLLKGGAGGGGITAQDQATPDPGNGAPGGSSGGGGDTSGQTDAAISALQQQQQSFQQSIVDQFNSLVSSITGALGQQQSQNQAAIDALGAQLQSQGQAQSPLQMGSMTDLSNLLASLQAVPSQEGAYKSPGFGLGGGQIGIQALKPASIVTGINKSLLDRVKESRRITNLPPLRPSTLPLFPQRPGLGNGIRIPLPAAPNRPHLSPSLRNYQRVITPRQYFPIGRPRVSIYGHGASSNRSSNRLVGF